MLTGRLPGRSALFYKSLLRGIILEIMGREISDEELKKAKEKLACHIEPQKFSNGGASGSTPSSGGASSAAPADPSQFIGPDGKVFLTRMTSAGG
jgi:hypothetical protein